MEFPLDPQYTTWEVIWNTVFGIRWGGIDELASLKRLLISLLLWYISIYLFMQMFTTNTNIGCVIALVCTTLYWYLGSAIQVNMSWNLVSMGLFFPITQNIGLGFRRRDQALHELARLLGNLRSLWGAVHVLEIQNKEQDWVKMIDTLDDCGGEEQVRKLFDEILTSMVVYFDHKVRDRRCLFFVQSNKGQYFSSS